jgi:hypothetical protein
MHRGNKYVGALFLSAALMAPIGVRAAAAPQDDHERHEQEERERREPRRIYDSEHRDYHNWDQREDEVYRHWLGERHEAYVDFERLERKQQRAYWKWRHEHEEHEEHEHER